MGILQLLFFVFIGAVATAANDIGIGYTVSRFIKSGNGEIILFSFLLRMSLLAVIFCLTVGGNLLGSILFTVGVILHRLWFMVKSRPNKQLGV